MSNPKRDTNQLRSLTMTKERKMSNFSQYSELANTNVTIIVLDNNY